VTREEQLSWEARVGRPVAVAAFLSAILLIASLVYSSSVLNQSTNDTVDGLRLIHQHKAEVLITTVLQALSTALLAAPLWFLFKVTRYRRKELPGLARYLALYAPMVSAALLLIRQIQVAHVGDRVIAHLTAVGGLPPNDANDYAKNQLSHGSVQLVGGLALAAGLGLAFAFIMVSLNAMRAGVLSKFMGIIGIIVGVLFVIPLLGQVPIVEVFWVAALGALFLGRWPQGGRGPAWDSGEAIPWPSAQDRAANAAAARADRELDREAAPEPVAAGARRPAPEEGPDGDHPVVREHPRSKKKKRKRR
jgi:hypothetical protein